ncbi:HAD-like protein, partial [Cryphonectria parasitica EP155]
MGKVDPSGGYRKESGLARAVLGPHFWCWSSAPDELLRRWSQLELWPEVPEVLARLRYKGFRIGVVTNCSRELGLAAIHNVEQHTGRGFRFDAAMTAEDSGFYKPHRVAYESILAEMDVGAGDVLFVAGSAGDVQGATDAGMKVVWHNRVGLA